MRLVRCPACQTVFRLQPEQLRAHGGMVRCGHCFTLFDARENFVASSPPIHPAQAPAKAESIAPPAAPTAEQTSGDHIRPHAETLFVLEDPGSGQAITAPLPSDVEAAVFMKAAARGTAGDIDPLDFGVPNDFHADDPLAHPVDNAQSTQPADQHGLTSTSPSAPFELPTRSPHAGSPLSAYWPSQDEHEPKLQASPRETAAAAAEREALERARRMRERASSIVVQDRSDDNGRVEPRFNPDTRTTAERIAASQLDTRTDSTLSAESTAEDEAVRLPERELDDHAPMAESADRYAPVESPPASATSRWLQGLAIGVLLGLLGVQSVFLFRDEITRQWPELRGPYLAACTRLGCDLPLPREVSLIEIETSDLEIEPANPSQYILNAVVRNRARFPQQHPYLELTLTDSRDRPVIRRVIAPQDWVIPPEALTSGLSPASSHAVRLGFQTSGVASAVGYRLYAFFP